FIEAITPILKSISLQSNDSQLKTSAINNQDNKQKLDSETLELNKNTQNNIFISEGFDLWKRLYNEFDIDNSRTFRVDLRFLYEKMKDDGFISEFITITNFIDWLNTNHPRDKAITKLDYTDIK